MPRPAVFLDRDGTLNVAPPQTAYVLDPDGIELIEGAAQGAARLKSAGFLIVVVTNQACVGKGLIDAGTLERIHARLRDLLAAEGAEPDLVLHCPHTDADCCDCRKPKPGMLLDAAKSLDIDLRRSYMVGDSLRDMQAGRAAEVTTVFVSRDAYPGAAEKVRAFGPAISAGTLAQAADLIIDDARARAVI